MIHVAILNEDGVLTGFEDVEKANSDSGRVCVPSECDLQPGRYRWDGETFVPVSPGAANATTDDQYMAIAVALCFRALEEQKNLVLPGDTLRWLQWYENSIDNAGGN